MIIVHTVVPHSPYSGWFMYTGKQNMLSLRLITQHRCEMDHERLSRHDMGSAGWWWWWWEWGRGDGSGGDRNLIIVIFSFISYMHLSIFFLFFRRDVADAGVGCPLIEAEVEKFNAKKTPKKKKQKYFCY